MEAFIASLIFFALAMSVSASTQEALIHKAREGKKAQSRERPIHGNNRCPNPAEL